MTIRALKIISLAALAAIPVLGLAPSAQAVEIIARRSGYDESNNVPLAAGAADTNITMISGSATLPLSNVAFTAADFAAARSGGTAFSIQAHPFWIQPASFVDPQARWINSTGANFPAESVLYAIPFTITTTNITNATLNFDYACDDSLGDPSGPNLAGVYIGMGNAAGAATTPMITGGPFNVSTSATANITSLVQTGQNWLYVYQRDIGASASGTIFSATISVVPEPAIAGALVIGGAALLMRRPGRSRATRG